MLEQALFLLFINPAFPESDNIYGSGIKYVEETYEGDKPATTYPLLNIEIMSQDSEYNVIQPGIYAVDLSANKRTLLLFQGTNFVAESQVVQIIKHDNEIPVAEAKIGLIKNGQIIIIYRKDNLEVHGILHKYSPF